MTLMETLNGNVLTGISDEDSDLLDELKNQATEFLKKVRVATPRCY
jgi:hypothetical protein